MTYLGLGLAAWFAFVVLAVLFGWRLAGLRGRR